MGLFDGGGGIGAALGAISGGGLPAILGGSILGKGIAGGRRNPFSGLVTPELKELPKYEENEFVKKQKEALAGLQSPTALQAEALSDAKTTLPQYEQVRGQLRDEARRAGQEQAEALQRRFASLGALNTGAAIKTEQQAKQNVQKGLERELTNVGLQEAQQKMAIDEATKGRNLAREQFNAQQSFQDKVFRFDQGSKLAQLDLAFNQDALARAQAENDRLINQYNAELSGIVARQPKKGLIGGIVDDIFGSGGIGGLFG